MAKYTGDFRSDFIDDIAEKLVPFVYEQFPRPRMEAYWYVDPDGDKPELVYGVREKGCFGDIDKDDDLTVYTLDLDVDPDWLEAEYDWSRLSEMEQKGQIEIMMSGYY